MLDARGPALPSSPPFKRLPQKGPDVSVEHRADGAILVRSNHAMGRVPRSIPHLLSEKAAVHPDRPLLKQRAADHGPWQQVTYGNAKGGGDSIAQWLLDRGLTQEDAVLCLSANSLSQGLLMLGCYTAGVPIVPISPAYCLVATDHAKLRHCFSTVRPTVVFAEDATRFAGAFETLSTLDPELIFVTVDGGGGSIAFAELTATEPTEAVDRARNALTHASVAKYLFTSGSTGMPKAVPQTQGMLVNLVAAREGLLDGSDPVDHPIMLDWMPWNHISAGNLHFNNALYTGATLYLDEGKPVPGLFETTIKNLYDVSPFSFATAPAALTLLAEAMERDPSLRSAFFRNLRHVSCGGATLSRDVYDRMQALAVGETGERIPFTTMYGATETQGVTVLHWTTERGGSIGLPLPGTTLKLVPNGGKLEARVKSPTVTTGYLHDPERTAAAFDEEGFYRLGDALRFLDPDRPEEGLVFDGRVTEDFKLSSGTWVSVGTLRPDICAACAPYVQDAVIAGQDQSFVGILAWPSPAALENLASADPGADPVAMLAQLTRERLRAFNVTAGGSSRRVERFVLLRSPPSLSDGEITDKGYVNQRAALSIRAGMVADLFVDPPPEGVIEVGRESRRPAG